MNRTQWALLDAMGISTWQRTEVGELSAPASLNHPLAMDSEILFVILVEQDDLFAHRTLFQSMLSAVKWPVQHYRLLTHIEQFDSLNQQHLKLVWCLGPFEVSPSEAKLIQSPALAELAQDASLKSALWSELKPFRHV